MRARRLSKRRSSRLAAGLLCVVLAASMMGMASAGYRMNWFVPLTGGGGGPSTSAGYAANYTVGQTVVGNASSAGYRLSLGYWPGSEPLFSVYLPLLRRSP